MALLFAKRCQFLVLHLFIYFFNFKAIWASQDNHGVILLCTPRKASQLRGFCFMLPTGETFRKSRNHFILCILLKLKQVNLLKLKQVNLSSQDNHGVILLCTPRKASQLRGFCFMLPTGETFRKSRNHFILCILLKLKQVNLSKINLLKCSFCTLNTLYTISSIIKYKSYKFYRDYFLHSLCTVLLAAHEH